jgi:hypothetical protein
MEIADFAVLCDNGRFADCLVVECADSPSIYCSSSY